MKRTGRNLDDMLGLIRENQPAQSLYAPGDLQKMMTEVDGKASASFGKTDSRLVHYRNHIVAISVAGLILAGTLFYFGRDVSGSEKMAVSAAPGHATSLSPSTVDPTNRKDEGIPSEKSIAAKAAPLTIVKEKNEKGNGKTSGFDTVAGMAISKRPEVEHKPLIPGILRFVNRQPEQGDTTRDYSQGLTLFDEQGDVGGIRFLDLTRRELEGLGIRFAGEKMVFTMQQQFRSSELKSVAPLQELGYDPSNPTSIVGFEVTADTFDMSYKGLPSKDFVPSSVAPVLYSGRWVKPNGHEGLSMIYTTESPLLEKLGTASKDLHSEVFSAYDGDADNSAIDYHALNELVPVRIRLESDEFIEKAGKHTGSEILLWYVPTPEFIRLLPERYRVSLEKELKLIASIERGSIPAGEACKRMAGETVLMDFCRSGSGLISYARAWPNPAREKITLNYVLAEPRHVGITLHDLSGKFLGELTSCSAQSAGQHQQTVSLDGLSSGAYLLTIRTDNGEQAVQRIIVQ